MKRLLLLLLFIHSFGVLRFCRAAAVSEKPRTTSLQLIFNRSQKLTTASGDEYIYEEDDEEEEDEEFSGDYEPDYPKVAFSTKPKDSSVVAVTRNRTRVRKTSKSPRKDPCLKKKNKNYCIHGVCQYIKELKKPTCICDAGYSGERCHSFSLRVGKIVDGYSQTTSLVIMAVVLSLMCLTIIAILLALRYHKKNNRDVQSDEKIKLEAATVQV